MNLLTELEQLESNDSLHIGRLLILIGEFSQSKNSKGIEGLTKLAKLDFLLRYPVYLEKALEVKELSISGLEISDSERISVESSMVRFRYGPWDSKHRRLINIMIGKGLLSIEVMSNTTHLKLTQRGIGLSEELGKTHSFVDVKNRAIILNHYFDLPGGRLKDFIYATFPEIITLNWGDEIPV